MRPAPRHLAGGDWLQPDPGRYATDTLSWMGRVGLLLVLVVLGAGCGGSASTSSERPCVVAEEEMASIWNVPAMRAFPQGNGYQCIYAVDGQPVISLAVARAVRG